MTKGKDLVLRSFYLPLDVDEALRVIAFKERISKAELIRRVLHEAISKYDVQVPRAKAKFIGNIPEDQILGIPVSEIPELTPTR